MPLRLKILLGCLCIAAAAVVLGIYLLAEEKRLGALAIRGYDDAFTAMSHARSAQARFTALADDYRYRAAPAAAAPSERQRLLATARGAATPADGPNRVNPKPFAEQIGAVIDDLEIVRRQAISANGRQLADGLLATLVPLKTLALPAAGLAGQLEAVGSGFGPLIEAYAADGVAFRRRVDDLIADGERMTWIAIAVSIGVALLITLGLSQAIVPPLRRAVRIAAALAEVADMTRAVEQQVSVIDEIARSVHQTASAVQAVSVRVAELSGESEKIGGLADQLNQTSGGLLSQIHRLKDSLNRIVRTAALEPA
jgi:methyl-accepting chemotaxis protein